MLHTVPTVKVLQINLWWKVLSFLSILHERKPNLSETQWYTNFSAILIQIKVIVQKLEVETFEKYKREKSAPIRIKNSLRKFK